MKSRETAAQPRRARVGAKPRALTPFEYRFCEEMAYARTASQAYVRAGGDSRRPRQSAHQLLERPAIRAEVERLTAERKARLEAESAAQRARVLEEVEAIAYSDIGDILDFTGSEARLRPAKDIPPEARRAIASVKVKRLVGSRIRESVEVIEFRLWNKPEALVKRGQDLGMFKEALEVTGKDGEPLIPIAALHAALRDAEDHAGDRE